MESETKEADQRTIDVSFMRLALEEAECASREGEVPVGALLVIDGEIVVRCRNKRESRNDPTAHAELIALRESAIKIGNWRLPGATLYVTKEPCVMCAGAMVNARLGRLVYACDDPKGGAQTLYGFLTDGRLNHQVDVTAGVLHDECALLLRKFFQLRR